MTKKQIAYILIAAGAVAGGIYYLNMPKTADSSADSTGGTGSTQATKPYVISDDQVTYKKIKALIPADKVTAVTTLAQQKYVAGVNAVHPWITASGKVTFTGALVSAYLTYFGVSSAETNNRIQVLNMWDAFSARS